MNDSPTRLPGVDQPLPEGEELLWTGRPQVGLQLRHSLALRLAGLWLALAALLPFLQPTEAGAGPPLAHLAWVGVTAAVILAMASGFAWLVHRTTTYAITDRRVVLAHGIALPSVLNIPLERLSGATSKVHADGSGDISLPLKDGEERIGYALLWPHARPWRIARPQPSLRWLDDVEEAAAVLTRSAMAAGDFEEHEAGDARRAHDDHRRAERAGLAGSPA